MKNTRHDKFSGFTIVEIIVAVAVIGILAGVSFVSYSSYQQRVRDTARQSDLQQLAAALKTNLTWNGDYIETGSNCAFQNNGEGWVSLSSAESPTTYGTSLEQCLVNRKLLEVGEATDPTGCKWNSGGVCGSGNPTRAYMKMHCTIGGSKKAYVLASLETKPANNAVVDSLCTTASGCTASCNSGTWGTAYGMNYYLEVM